MAILLTLFALLSPIALDFTAAVQKVVHPFQTFCLQRVRTYALPTTTEGIVCGSTDFSPEQRKDFLKTGVYHVLVVSGAHFLTLQRICSGLPAGLRFFPLLLFFLISGGSAPALRAFIHLCFNALSTMYRLNWSWIDRLILSTTFIMCLFCSLLRTKSLLLSVICATVFGAASHSPQLTEKLPSAVSKTLLVSLLAGIVMASSSTTHPLGWFVGAALSPAFGVILFPLLLLNWILPDLNPWVLPLMKKVDESLSFISDQIPNNVSGISVSSQFSWAAVFIVLLILKIRTRT